MSTTKDCPLNDGNHRYFLFKTYEVFEPVLNQGSLYGGEQIYEKVEYAILGCNCSSVVKTKVKVQ
jgi:hypothetical protein